MSKDLNNLTDTIMEQIRGDEIKMRPKIYFIVGSLLTFAGLVSSVVISVFVIGLMQFSLRAHGPMAAYRLDQLLATFPWWAPMIAIAGMGAGIWLLRTYDVSFKIHFPVLVAGFVLAVLAGGWVVDSIGLNDALLRQGPMRGMMQRYAPHDPAQGFPMTRPALPRHMLQL